MSHTESHEKSYELPDVSQWPDSPVLVHMHPASSVSTDVKSAIVPVNMGSYAFESKLFKGHVSIRFRGLSSTDESYFEGKQRATQFVIQGQFKEEVACDDVQCGNVFQKPFTEIPWVVSGILSIIRRIAPSMQTSIDSEKPTLVSTMGATCQTIHIQRLDEKPCDMHGPITEDTRLLGGAFQSNLSVHGRKAVFNDIKQCSQYSFQPGLRYTFEFYQHWFWPCDYSFRTIVGNYTLTDYLDGQPCQIHSLTKSGRCVWRFDIWHTDFITDPEHTGSANSTSSRSATDHTPLI